MKKIFGRFAYKSRRKSGLEPSGDAKLGHSSHKALSLQQHQLFSSWSFWVLFSIPISFILAINITPKSSDTDKRYEMFDLERCND